VSRDPFYRTNAWLTLRYRTLARDRWRCTVCGTSVRTKGSSRVDHIIPRKERPGLELDPGNVRTLCVSCDNKRHSEKGGRHVERPEIAIDGLPATWRT
jgi:5-methylcytosine-specific restriction endonuclease McrA